MLNLTTDTALYFIFGMIVVLILILLVIKLVVFLNEFSHEVRIINCEIERTTGAERRYWIRKKRRLWLSLIPFVKY